MRSGPGSTRAPPFPNRSPRLAESEVGSVCRVEISLLGPLVVTRDGERLAVGAQKERALCAALALRVGETVSIGELVDVLWDADPPATAVKTLQGYISKLRRVLGPDVVRTDRPGYRLGMPREAVDLFRFRDLVADARQAVVAERLRDAIERYADALALWRGDPLVDLAGSELGRGEIARLDETRPAVMEELLDARLAIGDHHLAIADLEALVVDEPLRERAWGLLMLALYRAGRQADALRTYQTARSALIERVGVEPGPSLKDLESAIISQDPSLHLGRPSSAGASGGDDGVAGASRAAGAAVADVATSTGDGDRLGRTTHAPLPSSLTWLHRSLYPFAGRDVELARLAATWDEVLTTDRRQAVLLGGEPGIGKTRLAAEAAAEVHGRGGIVLFGACEEGLGAPYQPFVEALTGFVRACPPTVLADLVGPLGSELTRLVPELARLVPSLAAPATADSNTERLRLFEAVSELFERIGTVQPVLVVLDDLQWATEPTLLLFRHVLGAPRPARLMVVATYRPTDLDRVHPLADILADLRRNEQTCRISLDGLDEGAAIALASAAADHDLSDESKALVRHLHRECNGNPFFFWTVLTDLVETGTIVRRDGRWTHSAQAHETRLPEGIREVVARRLSSLPDATIESLHVAALIGSAFDARVVADVRRVQHTEVLDAIGLACDAGVIIDQPRTFGRFSFTHDLVRRSLAEELPTTRRTRLHWRIVEVLTDHYGSEVDEHLDELARHASEGALAGDPDIARAILHRAGDAALAALAFEEAAAYYEDALSYVDRSDSGPRFALLLSRGRALQRAGNAAYQPVIRDAIAVARAAGDGAEFAEAVLELHPNVSLNITAVHDAELRALLQEGLERFGPQAPGIEARLSSALALTLSLSDQRDRSIDLSTEALALARRSGQPRVLAQVLTDHGWVITGPDTVDRRLELGAEAVAVSRGLGDHAGMINGFNCLAEAWLELGDLDQARAALDEGLELAEYLRRPAAAWSFRVHLGSLAALQTDVSTVEARAEDLLDMGTSLGIEPGTVLAVYSRLLFAARYEQGRLGEFEAPLAAMAAEQPGMSWSVVLGVIHSETGRLAAAARVLDRIRHGGPNRDLTWVVFMMLASLLVAELRDEGLAPSMYDELLPMAGRNSHDGAATCGPVDLALGRLAAVLNRRREAEQHFEASARLCGFWNAPMWAAHTAYEQAKLLIDGSDADRARALALLASCAETASATGQVRLLERASALRGSDAT